MQFLKIFLTLFGCPGGMYSNLERKFAAIFFKSLRKLNQINKTRTTAFQ